MKKPKIALLLSGHTRSLDFTIKNILNLKSVLNSDIFIHSWSTKEMTLPTWHSPEEYTSRSINHELLQRLEPKEILIENQINDLLKYFKSIDLSCEINDANLNSGSHFMIYGMFKVFQLMELHEIKEKIQYDIVIRYRFDLLCNDIEKIISDIHNAKYKRIMMPPHNWANSIGAKFDGVIVAQKDDYKKILNNVLNYYNDLYHFASITGTPIPEAIISSIIKKDYSLVDTLSSFSLIRNNNISVQKFYQKYKFFGKLISSVHFIKFHIDKNENLNSYNIQLWHENTSLIIRVLSFMAFIIKNRNFKKIITLVRVIF